MSNTTKIDKLKEQAEEIGRHLRMKSDDAKAEFEEQKSKLKKWLSRKEVQLKDFEETTDEKLDEVGEEIKAFSQKLDVGSPENREEFLKQKESFENHVNKIDQALEDTIHDGEDDWDQFKNEFKSEMKHFESKLEIFKAHFTLKKQELEAVLDKKSKELGSDMKSAIKDIEEGVHDMEEKASALWSSFKKGFNKES